MLPLLSLRKQIYLLIGGLIVIIIAGGLVIIQHANRMEEMILNVVDKELIKYQITEKMEKALVNQKGFVTYFYVDQDSMWLEQLGIYRQVFKERLDEISLLDSSEKQQKEIEKIKESYRKYVTLINRVIEHYKKGDVKQGFQLHLEARQDFIEILKACEVYKDIQTTNIRDAWFQGRIEGENLIASVLVTAIIVIVLALVLILLLVIRILDPLQRLALEARGTDARPVTRNEIQVLSENIHGLLEDAGHTHEELQQSRAILAQSEKLALVGKLAAGMAHSIRNPLTSVTMRLFSLSRSLNLSESQKEDFDVISKEIRHLDIIVQNFLEFARPPRLSMQLISLSDVVDQSLQLLEHRLKSYNVTVMLNRISRLTAIQCDPEQLKEVFVNLIVNACEAMKTGGVISIEEQEAIDSGQRSALVHVIDCGPGIPDDIIENIFQPFFSTKEEGTGLGLSIASRIVTDHGGKLDVYSQIEKGTTFTLTFPISGA